MPKVKVWARCIIAATPGVQVTYEPADEVLAPEAHIEEIVRRNCGERLTSRADPSADPSADLPDPEL